MTTDREQRMANCKHPLVDAMEPSRGDTAPGHPLVEPKLHQLPESHHPVLPSSEVGHDAIHMYATTLPTGRFRSIFERFRPIGMAVPRCGAHD